MRGLWFIVDLLMESWNFLRRGQEREKEREEKERGEKGNDIIVYKYKDFKERK